MKKIVRGNDLTLRIPVRKMVDGEAVKFALPACTDLEVSVVNAYRRTALEFVVEAVDDSVIDARLKTSAMGLGCYALEVKGKLFGNWWRSNEYEQFRLVDNNASADTEFDGEIVEGEDSVEMDTAIVFMPPTAEMSELVREANAAIEKAEKVDIDLTSGEGDNSVVRIVRSNGEQKEFDLMQLKGEKGDKLTFADLTEEDVATLQQPALDAASSASSAAEAANTAAEGAANVNADLTEGNVLNVTDRTGTTKSVELAAPAEAAQTAKDMERVKQVIGLYGDAEEVEATSVRLNRRISPELNSTGSSGVIISTGYAVYEFDLEPGCEYIVNTRMSNIPKGFFVAAQVVSTPGILTPSKIVKKYDADNLVSEVQVTYPTRGTYKYYLTREDLRITEIKENYSKKNGIDYYLKDKSRLDVVPIDEIYSGADVSLPEDKLFRFMTFPNSRGSKYYVSCKYIDNSPLVIKKVRSGLVSSIYSHIYDINAKTAQEAYTSLSIYSDAETKVMIDGKEVTIKKGENIFKNPVSFSLCDTRPENENAITKIEIEANNYQKSSLISFATGKVRTDNSSYIPSYITPNIYFRNNTFSGATSLAYAFAGGHIVALGNMDTSNVIDMSYMFFYAQNKYQITVSFDTSNVVDMSFMFYYADDFSIKLLNLEKVENMERMFAFARNCGSIFQLENTKSLKNMAGMFYGYKTSLTEVKMDTSNVTDMSNVFCSAKVFDTLSLKFDTSNVTTMRNMFRSCNMSSIYWYNKFNTSNVEDMFMMFFSCTNLQRIDLTSFDTHKVKNFKGMFSDCTSLTSLDVSSFDLGAAEDVTGMFSSCPSLATLYLGEGFGKMPNEINSFDFSQLSAWANDSVKTLLSLYDRKANGMSTLTIKLHANTKTVLGEDGIAQLTAKGYTIA